MFRRYSAVPLVAGILYCMLLPTNPVMARPFAITHYEYYSVSGVSAASLHQSLVVHGPQVNGYKAYVADLDDRPSERRTVSRIRKKTAAKIKMIDCS